MPISIPKFFQRAFAQNGGKQDVPITGDTSGGRASYDVGFPPVTRVPIVAGGIPPFGTDFNGVLYDLSQAIQYVQSGVAFPFNQDFATAIGGYEIGAIVSDESDKSLLWVNGTANNTAFPSGWTSFNRSDPTETVRGLPLVATQAETNAGTNDSKLVTPKKLKDGGLWPLGVGQTWQNVIGQRSSGTVYTNTTGRTIAVSARGNRVASGGGNISLSINGDLIMGFDSGGVAGLTAYPSFSVFGIIPPGDTYAVTGSTGLTSWWELRA